MSGQPCCRLRNKSESSKCKTGAWPTKFNQCAGYSFNCNMMHCLSIARHKSMKVVQMEPVCKFGWATVMQQLREFFADGNTSCCISGMSAQCPWWQILTASIPSLRKSLNGFYLNNTQMSYNKWQHTSKINGVNTWNDIVYHIHFKTGTTIIEIKCSVHFETDKCFKYL